MGQFHHHLQQPFLHLFSYRPTRNIDRLYFFGFPSFDFGGFLLVLFLKFVKLHAALLHDSPFELRQTVNQGQILEVQSLRVAQHLHQQKNYLFWWQVFKNAGDDLLFFEIGMHGVEYLVDWS